MNYAKIYLAFVKNSIRYDLEYKSEFIMNIFLMLLGYADSIIFYLVLFQNVNTVAGWGLYELLLLSGFVILVDAVFFGLFFFNLIRVPMLVQYYDLDQIMLKPINSLFYVSTNRISMGYLVGGLGGIAVMLYAARHLNLVVSLEDCIVGGLLLASSMILMYSLLSILISVSLYFVKVDGLIQMFWSLMDFGRRPATIYSYVVKGIFTVVIPVIIIYNFPVRYILNALEIREVVFMLLVSIIWLFIANKVWFKCLQKYYN